MPTDIATLSHRMLCAEKRIAALMRLGVRGVTLERARQRLAALEAQWNAASQAA